MQFQPFMCQSRLHVALQHALLCPPALMLTFLGPAGAGLRPARMTPCLPAELAKGANTTVFTQQEVTSEELRTDAKVTWLESCANQFVGLTRPCFSCLTKYPFSQACRG